MIEISSKRNFENKSYQPNIKIKPPNRLMRKEGLYKVPETGFEPANGGLANRSLRLLGYNALLHSKEEKITTLKQQEDKFPDSI